VSKELSSSVAIAQSDSLGNGPSSSLLMINPTTVELASEIIPQEWILSGHPQARCKKVVRSRDWTSHIVVWDCTPGTFKWHFAMDETIVVLSGEAFMINEKGEERRFGQGEMGFFPAGTSCTWRIDEHFMKIGILREPVWRPIGLAIKAWRRLLQIAGLAEPSPIS
jgi:uncharacterized protein